MGQEFGVDDYHLSSLEGAGEVGGLCQGDAKVIKHRAVYNHVSCNIDSCIGS